MVVPTYERPDDLERCLKSLDQNFQKLDAKYEIIVSDDSVSDKSKILIERNFQNVIWKEGKKKGPAANRNVGALEAKGEWIVFLDDDCIAQKNYLEAYCKSILNDPEILVFEGKIFADRKRVTWAEGCPENENGGMLWTSNLCVKKSLFKNIGGFDERFRTAYEDVEFAFRLKQFGIKSIFVPQAAVCHPWRSLRNGGKNWKVKGYQIDSLLLFLDKHENAYMEYGRPLIYLRNMLRILTSNLCFCLLNLGGRGIDILFSQAYIALQTCILLTFKKNK